MIEITEGDAPLILAFPHTGTDVPVEIADRLNDEGRHLRDTDWHVDRLYEDLLPGATKVRMPVHRYVIDVNRDPSGKSLYPGQNTTDLVPTTTFDGDPIWSDPPMEVDVADRLAAYHTPYHAAIRAQIDRVKARHGVALLYDCHSIRSVVPRLFDGTLPDLNIGTADGAACDPGIEAAADRIAAASPFSHVVNGRFKGGWTTRAHGRPSDGVQAIQMELAQSTHLSTETPPFQYDTAKADRLRHTLSHLLHHLTTLIRARP